MKKEIIKLNFVDIGEPSQVAVELKNNFIRVINTFAEVQISEDPDFLVCGSYGDDHWNYNCIKIFYAMEELEPDFNIFDYAISQSKVDMYDRHLQEVQYFSNRFHKNTQEALTKHEKTDEYFLNKSKFCNFIYSNGQADKFREEVFQALNKYKHVDSAGKFLNNMGSDQIAGGRYENNWQESKIRFMQDYRFTIAFGNAEKYDYADEKIFDAWNAGTIPIFWGDAKFCERFNSKAYIDCCDCTTVEEVVARVREIEEDPVKYLAMQKEPIVYKDSIWYKYIKENQTETNLTEFLKYILLQPIKKAKRTSTGVAIKLYKRDLHTLSTLKNNFFFKVYRKLKIQKY